MNLIELKKAMTSAHIQTDKNCRKSLNAPIRIIL